MASDPIVRRVMVVCGASALFGVAVFFGWTMVRFPRFRGAEPAPLWLPWLAAGLTILPLVVILVVRSVVGDGGSRSDEEVAPPDVPGRFGPTAVAGAVIALFAAGLAVPALAAADSSARWDPLVLATLLPAAALAIRWWIHRRR